MWISWAATVGTLACIYLSGRKKVIAWPIGLVAQALWLVFSIQVGDSGLLALNIAVTGIYAYNWFLWRKADDN